MPVRGLPGTGCAQRLPFAYLHPLAPPAARFAYGAPFCLAYLTLPPSGQPQVLLLNVLPDTTNKSGILSRLVFYPVCIQPSVDVHQLCILVSWLLAALEQACFHALGQKVAPCGM